jgi:hypothetical protein
VIVGATVGCVVAVGSIGFAAAHFLGVGACGVGLVAKALPVIRKRLSIQFSKCKQAEYCSGWT